MRKLHLSVLAAEDLENILHFTLAKWGVIQFEKYLESFQQVFDSLLIDPRNFATYNRDELFAGCKSIRSGHHVVFFRIIKKDIEIIRILHEKMDFIRRFEEEEE